MGSGVREFREGTVVDEFAGKLRAKIKIPAGAREGWAVGREGGGCGR